MKPARINFPSCFFFHISFLYYHIKYKLFLENIKKITSSSIPGFLSTLSCQSSTLLLALVTWDRLVSVTRPLAPRDRGAQGAWLRLGTLWALAGLAAIAPLTGLQYFGEHFYGGNGVCLSIHIHDPYARVSRKIIKYSNDIVVSSENCLFMAFLESMSLAF